MVRKKQEVLVTLPSQSPVEDRLAQALIYKRLIEQRLFTAEEETSNPQVAIVRKEVDEFLRLRLEVLLGLKPDPNQQKKEVETILSLKKILEDIRQKVTTHSEFSDQEKQAIKALAKATMGKSEQTIDTSPPQEFNMPKPEDGIYALPTPKRLVKVKGNDGKEVTVDVTGQNRVQKDPDRLPMPSPGQVASMAMEHSSMMQGDSNSLVSSIMTVLSGGGVSNSTNEE